MSITRHAPDPAHTRETLCGQKLTGVGTSPHWLAGVGDCINCPTCRVIINFASKCVLPHRYVLARTP